MRKCIKNKNSCYCKSVGESNSLAHQSCFTGRKFFFLQDTVVAKTRGRGRGDFFPIFLFQFLSLFSCNVIFECLHLSFFYGEN